MPKIVNPGSEHGMRVNAQRPPNQASHAGPQGTDHDQEEKRLSKACAEFEALLVQQLFQTMRASIQKAGLIDGGSAEAIYTAMLDQKVAQDLALQGGLGLSARMKEQIIRYMDDLNSKNI